MYNAATYQKQWYTENIEHAKAARKEYYHAHKAEIKLKRISTRLKNRSKILLAAKEYYKTHKNEILLKQKKYQEDSKEIISSRAREYNKTYLKLPRVIARMADKKMLRKRNVVLVDSVSKTELLRRQNSTCLFCGKHIVDNGNTHMDHLIPVERYASLGKKCPHSYSNVLATCADCNRRKHTRTPLEYFWSKEEPVYECK